MRSFLSLLVVISLTTSAVCAGTTNACGGKQVSATVWLQKFTGTVGGSTGKASLVAEGESEVGFSLTLKTLGSICLDLSYTPLTIDTRFNSTCSFTFGGTQFGLVTSGLLSYHVPVWEGAVRWIALDNDSFRLGVSGCLKIATADVRLSANGSESAFKHVVPIPMLGLFGQANVTDWFKVYGSIKLLDLGLGSVHSRVHDWELGAMGDWSTSWKTIRLTTGWRDLGLEFTAQSGQSDETSLDITHRGPFVEATLSF